MKNILLLFTLCLAFTFAARAQTASIISENANLRGTPSQAGKVVETLPSGSTVEIIKQSGPWYLVQSPEFVGWIHGNTIRLEGGSSRASSPPAYETPVRRTVPDVNVSGATAKCNDGTLSYSQHRRGTCSHHGGVAIWY